MQTVEKLWGHEEIIHNDARYCCKKLFVRQGHQSSRHNHHCKTETFVAQNGNILLEVWKDEHGDPTIYILGVNENDLHYITLEPGTWHRFTGLSVEEAIFIECSTEDFADDSYRMTNSRKPINR